MDLEQLKKVVPENVRQQLGFDNMTADQQRVLVDWGMHMFSLGRHRIEDIDEVKYDGRLVILTDGSRWEVDSGDEYTADMWSASEKVLVADGEMWKLDDSEKISVQEES